MKQIVVHLPQHAKGSVLGTRILRFYKKLEYALSELNLPYQFVDMKDKALRQDTTFNHIVYHTRKFQPNWLNVKIGYLDDFFYLDERGYAGWSEISKLRFDPQVIDITIATKFFEELQSRFIKPMRTKYGGESVGNLRSFSCSEKDELPDRYNAVFLQVFQDEVLKLQRMSMTEMVNESIAASGPLPVVLKRHPLCVAEESQTLIEQALNSNASVYLTTKNVHSVLERADRVICINSGVGLEALLHGKQVIACGRTDYQHGVSQVNRDGDFSEAYSRLARSNAHIIKFLYWFLAKQLLDVTKDDFTRRVRTKLEKIGWLT